MQKMKFNKIGQYMTVEDLISALFYVYHFGKIIHPTRGNITPTEKWDIEFVNDLSQKISRGFAISVKQAAIAIKVSRKNIDTFELVFENVSKEEVTFACDNPTYRKPTFEATTFPREVRYLGKSHLGFRAPFNKSLNAVFDGLKKNGLRSTYNYFHKEVAGTLAKVRVVEVGAHNLDGVMEIIKVFKFDFDSEVENFFLECVNWSERTPHVELQDSNIVIQSADEILNDYLEVLSYEEQNRV